MEGFWCQECEKDFVSREALEQHNKSKHFKQAKPSTKTSKSNLLKPAILAGVLIILAVIAYAFISSQPPTDPRVPSTPIHWHPHLTIIIKDQSQIIPSGLGATGTIHSPLHTHDATGTLHYENNSPTLENMQLGYFFEKVWKKTFNSSCIFEYCNGIDGKVKMFVNGKENLEFEKFIPKEGDEIKIEYK